MAIKRIEDFSRGYFRKKKSKNQFEYINEKGKTIQSKEILARIGALVIPPAWEDVWITRDPDAHILATGIDEKKRKQYIYHPKWIQKKQTQKYNRIIELGYALPRIRRRVFTDLQKERFSKTVVLAIVVRILDKTGMRIGNEKYTEQNKTFGLTTLRERHIGMTGKEITFTFTGKSHQEQAYSIDDPLLAKHIHMLENLPGTEIFNYLDENGKRQKLIPEDVNKYIDKIAAGKDSEEELHFSAKDFRTWIGTTCAVAQMLPFIKEKTFPIPGEKQIEIIKKVAQELGNTPTVCKEHYIHPKIQKMFSQKTIPKMQKKDVNGLTKIEQKTLALLEYKKIKK